VNEESKLSILKTIGMDHGDMLAWTRMEMGRIRLKQGRVRRKKQMGLHKEFNLRERWRNT